MIFFACDLEEKVTQILSNCPKEYEGIFLLQKNMKGVDM